MEDLHAAWAEAIESGSRGVLLAERLLQRSWIFPLPLPQDAADDEAVTGLGASEPQQYSELVILGVYWGNASPDQPPVSVLLAFPEAALVGVADVVASTAACYNQVGAEFGSANVGTLLAAAEYAGRHLAEAVPANATTVTFMEESPGLLPNGAQLFAQTSLPRSAHGGAWLFLDDEGSLRLRWQGQTQEDLFFSASEAAQDEATELQQHIQPWLVEAGHRLPGRRGQRSRRPSVVGLGSSARQLGAMLSRAAPKPKVAAKAKSPPAQSGSHDEILQQILGAVTSMGDRVTLLEQRAPTAHVNSPQGAAPGFLPQSTVPGNSILASPKYGAAGGTSYQAALQEARRLIDGPPLQQGLVPPRRVPSGVTGDGGPLLSVEHRPGRERAVDAELKVAVAKGGADAQMAVNLAIIDALERVGQRSGLGDEDLIGDFFAHDNPLDPDATKASTSHGARSLAQLSRAVERNPERWIAQVDQAAARALGADHTGLPWTMELYADRMIRFRNEHLERTWAFLAHLHGLSRRGEHLLLAARLGQFLKATELAAQCNGSWKLAWAMTSLPEVRSCSAGSVGKGLAMPAEYAATVAWLKDQQTLETAMKKGEPEPKPKGGGPQSSPGNKQPERSKHKKGSSEGGGQE